MHLLSFFDNLDNHIESYFHLYIIGTALCIFIINFFIVPLIAYSAKLGINGEKLLKYIYFISGILLFLFLVFLFSGLSNWLFIPMIRYFKFIKRWFYIPNTKEENEFLGINNMEQYVTFLYRICSKSLIKYNINYELSFNCYKFPDFIRNKILFAICELYDKKDIQNWINNNKNKTNYRWYYYFACDMEQYMKEIRNYNLEEQT